MAVNLDISSEKVWCPFFHENYNHHDEDELGNKEDLSGFIDKMVASHPDDFPCEFYESREGVEGWGYYVEVGDFIQWAARRIAGVGG